MRVLDMASSPSCSKRKFAAFESSAAASASSTTTVDMTSSPPPRSGSKSEKKQLKVDEGPSLSGSTFPAASMSTGELYFVKRLTEDDISNGIVIIIPIEDGAKFLSQVGVRLGQNKTQVENLWRMEVEFEEGGGYHILSGCNLFFKAFGAKARDWVFFCELIDWESIQFNGMSQLTPP